MNATCWDWVVRPALASLALFPILATGAAPVPAAGPQVQEMSRGSWSRISGNFRIDAELLVCWSSDDATALTRAVSGQAGWRDYLMSAKIRLDRWHPQPGADFGLIARYQDPGNYYIFLYKRDTKKLVVERKLKGQLKILAEVPYALEPGIWHDFQVSVRGNLLKARVNGGEWVQYRDESFHQGSVGLLAFWADLQCRDFNVKLRD